MILEVIEKLKSLEKLKLLKNQKGGANTYIQQRREIWHQDKANHIYRTIAISSQLQQQHISQNYFLIY